MVKISHTASKSESRENMSMGLTVIWKPDSPMDDMDFIFFTLYRFLGKR